MSQKANPLLAILTMWMLTLSALAQSAGPENYLVTDYMKVAPENGQAYVDLELNIWAKIHQARLEAGQITGWYFYRINFPGGTGAEYNFVTVTAFDDFSKIDDDWSESLALEELLGDDFEDLFIKTVRTRDLVKSELWVQHNQVGLEAPDAYAEVNYMKVPEWGIDAWLELEDTVWKPVHQIMFEQGNRVGWGAYELMLPRGSSLKYNVCTVDFHGSFESVNGSYVGAAVDAAYPDATEDEMQEMFEKTLKSRTIVRTELWERIHSVIPEQE